jgi:hypothetical protein
LDTEKRFFAAVGGGAVRRGSLVSFFNPFSRIWCGARRALQRMALLALTTPRARALLHSHRKTGRT